MTEPHGYPIRIAVRVDFSDGTQHDYEVRGQDTVDAPGGFWPEPVVTSDVAQRLDYARKRAEEIRQLKQDLEALLVVATQWLDAFTDEDLMTLPEKFRHQEVEEIVQRRGKRY